MNQADNPGSESLATLMQLGRRAREADDAAELRFLLVNESVSLVNYRQAALWTEAKGVEVLSGVSSVERSAPYTKWLDSWFKRAPKGDKTLAYQTDLRLLAQNDDSWKTWLPAHLVSVTLPSLGRFSCGRLMLARDSAFTQAELQLIQEWCDIWRGVYQHKAPRSLAQRLGIGRDGSKLIRNTVKLGLVAGVVAISQIPVSLSVLAPAELIPKSPAIVRAPMDGIIDSLAVQPNEQVKYDQPLFEFDRVALKNRLEVARRSLATTQTEYRARAQRALFDAESKAQLVTLKSQIEEREVEVEYLQALNARSTVLSPQPGIVLLDDATEWIGRPVVTGERIMMIARENQVLVEAWLSPSDILPLEVGSPVYLFLSADPTTPVNAKLTYLAHQPEMRPDGNFAYRARAELLDSEDPRARVGLKGTARLEGEQVSLLYWVSRRPWAALRGWTGF